MYNVHWSKSKNKDANRVVELRWIVTAYYQLGQVKCALFWNENLNNVEMMEKDVTPITLLNSNNLLVIDLLISCRWASTIFKNDK